MMKSVSAISLWLSFILFSLAPVAAQQLPPDFRFNKFTAEDGLSDNYVYDIIKDHQGYLWIATQNGINRFDGVEFKTFTHDQTDSNSLLDNYVGFLAEDSLGRIWAATAGGLSMYNPYTGKFRNYIPDAKKFVRIRVYKVLKARDGSIWFSTWNYLHQINLQSLKITSYPVDTLPPDKRSLSIDNFFEDHEGNFWFDSYHGLSLFNRATHSVKVMDKNFGLSAFYDDGSGVCWMGCWFNALRKFDFSSKTFTDFLFSPDEESLRTRDIQCIERFNYPGLESLLWIGTDRELVVFDLHTKQFTNYYKHNPGSCNSLSAGFVNKIFFDGKDAIWFGCESGLFNVHLNQLAIRSYFFPELKHSETARIRADRFNESRLWIAFLPGGLYELDRNSGEVIQQFVPEKKFDLGLNYMKDFVQQEDGVFWIADNNGIIRYDPASKQWRIITDTVNIEPGGQNSFQEFLQDADGTIWFVSYSGLGRFDPSTEKIHHYLHYPANDRRFGYHEATTFIRDYEGNLWIPTNYDGLQIFNTPNQKFKVGRVPSKDFTHSQYPSITLSADSTIWFSIGDQLFFRKKSDTAFHKLHDKMMDGTIYSVTCDKESNLFMGMQTGMLEYEKSTGRFIKYTTLDGLEDNKLFNGIEAASDGKLIIRGFGYITEIDPVRFRKRYADVPLVLESFTVGYKDSVIDFIRYKTNPISLSHSQNQFTVHFRLLSFKDPLQVNYTYKLDGWDKDWTAPNSGTYASYSNLPGGTYTLLVKAINPDGTENLQQATMMIHIIAPYWQRWWFIALCILAVSSFLYFLYRLRVQRLLAVQRVRSEISRDLHDEIGATLSSVQIMSTFAEQSLDSSAPDAKRWVNRIGDNTKEMMEKIRDIVWTLNPSKEISGNIITRMKQFASQTLEAKDIAFTFKTDEKVNEAVSDFIRKRNVYLIFKEAVNNAAKYSQCREVKISLSISEGKLMMLIADNGKGFDSEKTFSGNGLKNMKQRAQQMGAKLTVNSAEACLPDGQGKGTTVSLLLPIPRSWYVFQQFTK